MERQVADMSECSPFSDDLVKKSAVELPNRLVIPTRATLTAVKAMTAMSFMVVVGGDVWGVPP